MVMSISVWNSDKKQIAAAFYGSLDMGAIIDGISKIQNSGIDDNFPKKWAYVASGRHFNVHKFSGKSLDYAIKIANLDLFQHEDHRLFVDFKKKMSNLKKAACYLVPPYEVLEVNRGIILIQPFGHQPIEMVAPAYKPFDEAHEMVRENLREHGFAIEDVLQFRCWNHIPILVDFSDLIINRGS